MAKEDYQSLSNKLDEILDQLQNPNLDIDEAMKLYSEGQKVITELEEYLKTVQNKLKISKG